MLKEGDKMPEFQVQDQDGNYVTDKDLSGKKIVLYFYPKDSTPGCTAEACNLRDNFGALRAAGYEVYGVSKDSVASHTKFREKNSLPFTLLSDPSTEMLKAFGKRSCTARSLKAHCARHSLSLKQEKLKESSTR